MTLEGRVRARGRAMCVIWQRRRGDVRGKGRL